MQDTSIQYTTTCGFVIRIMRDYADLRMNNIQHYADLQLQLYINIQIYKWALCGCIRTCDSQTYGNTRRNECSLYDTMRN